MLPPSLTTVGVTVGVLTTGGPTMLMEKACVASGLTPLETTMVPVKTPPTVGVPLMTPALLTLRFVGSAPGLTVNEFGVGAPVVA